MSGYLPSVYIIGASGQLYLVTSVPTYAGVVNETVNMYDGQNIFWQGFAADAVGGSDSNMSVHKPVGVAAEFAHFEDTFGALWNAVYEGLTADGVLLTKGRFNSFVQELAISPAQNSLNGQAWAFPVQLDAAGFSEKVVLSFVSYLSETLGISLSLSTIYTALPIITNLIKLVGAQTVTAHAALTVAEVVGALEKVAGALAASAENNETIGLNMAVLGAILLQYTVSEHVSLLDSIPASAKAYPALAELLGLQDAQSSGFGKEISETAGLTALIADLLSARPQIIDILNSLDSTAPTFVVQITCSDTAEIIDPPTGNATQAILQALASENFSIFIGYTANDGVYDGWVINTNSSAVSQYKGWAFNSFAEFYGQYLGASASGLSVLNGTTDAGALISATIQTAVTDLGSSHQKRVRSAYLGIAATGTCYLQVLTDDNVERTYQLVPNAPGLGNERVDLARGVQSRYWSFSLESVDGSAWRLDNLEVLPVVLSRRVR